MALPIKFNAKTTNVIKDKELAEKLKAAKPKKISSNNIMDVIEKIRQDVDKNLGKFRDQYQVFLKDDKQKFFDYIAKANKHGFIALDTETTGLDPIDDSIVGLCLYFPGEPALYVPINHVNYITDVRYDNQLTEEDVREVMATLTAKIIYHNAPFDIRVMWNQVGIRLSVFWDTLAAANLYNENEEHGLKYLHGKYISKDNEKTFSDLFGNIRFQYIPIEYAYLYAAHDAIDTYELAQFQNKFFKQNPELLKLLQTVEIPMVDVIVDLENNGVAIDFEWLDLLHTKYNHKVDEAYNVVIDTCMNYTDQIELYNSMNPNKRLRLPLDIGSAQQLGILFYDILKCKPLPDKKPRSVDEDTMNEFAKTYPMAKSIMDYRSAVKLTSTYINNIPNIVKKDGRVHTHFNSCGAKTGRMSSAQPINLQNIPSHNDEIRQMFTGQTTTRDVEKRSDGAYIFDRCEEIQLSNGNWQWVELVKVGDTLSDGSVVKVVKVKEFKVLIGV